MRALVLALLLAACASAQEPQVKISPTLAPQEWELVRGIKIGETAEVTRRVDCNTCRCRVTRRSETEFTEEECRCTRRMCAPGN
jgi:hypothetical protein